MSQGTLLSWASAQVYQKDGSPESQWTNVLGAGKDQAGTSQLCIYREPSGQFNLVIREDRPGGRGQMIFSLPLHGLSYNRKDPTLIELTFHDGTMYTAKFQAEKNANIMHTVISNLLHEVRRAGGGSAAASQQKDRITTKQAWAEKGKSLTLPTPGRSPEVEDAEALAVSLMKAVEVGDKSFAMELASQLANLKPDLDVAVRNKDGPRIRLRVSIEDKDMCGGQYMMDVHASTTIYTLKRMVLERLKFPIPVQRWVIQKRLCQDEWTLAKCGVRGSGHTAYLYLLTSMSAGIDRNDLEPLEGAVGGEAVPHGAVGGAALQPSLGAAGGIATPSNTLERRAGVVDPTLEVGDMVEVLGTPPRYGVIKWVGNLPDIKNERLVAGIELDEELEACTDGTFKEKRYFTCPAKRGLFVFLDKCARDQRFEVPRPDEPPPSPSVAFGNYNAPTIQDDTLPPESLTLDLVGRAKGIQGHHNSCYLDATLYSMFAFSSVFDVLLHRPTSREDLPQYGEVQRLLRENIVNPLRVEGFVRADQTLKLRKLLDQLGSIPGLLSEEKDPEEFLTTMLKDVFKADPFLKIRSGSNKQEDCYFYQLFVEKDEKVLVPTVQQLLEQSCLATDIKITEMPSCLLVQMPRFGRDFKIYDRVIPSLTLDITDLLENVPRECTMCGSCGEVECKDCYMEKVFFQNNTSHIVTYCNICNLQSHKKRRGHKPTPIQVPESFRRRHDHSGLPVPRMTMDLFAVVCIQTSHYVAFVKCGNELDAPWVFFDSMADRIGEQNGHNIPEVSEIHDLKQWLEDEEAITKQTDKELPEHVRRLLCDSYICMYQNRDVAMYK